MAYHSDLAGGTFESGCVSGGSGGSVSHLAVQDTRRIIAFVGMAFEARIAAGPGVLVICRNDRSQLADLAGTAARQGYRGMISFGVAGGLTHDLRPGDWVVASAVHETQSVRETDAAWSKKLLTAVTGAQYAPILGVDDPVAEPAVKRELFQATGAAAVDMESHLVSRLAAAHGLAFAALRVIVDPAERAVPRAALAGMRPDGRTDFVALLRDLMTKPTQLAQLMRLAFDALAARTELQRVRQLLGPQFGLANSV